MSSSFYMRLCVLSNKNVGMLHTLGAMWSEVLFSVGQYGVNTEMAAGIELTLGCKTRKRKSRLCPYEW